MLPRFYIEKCSCRGSKQPVRGIPRLTEPRALGPLMVDPGARNWGWGEGAGFNQHLKYLRAVGYSQTSTLEGKVFVIYLNPVHRTPPLVCSHQLCEWVGTGAIHTAQTGNSGEVTLLPSHIAQRHLVGGAMNLKYLEQDRDRERGRVCPRAVPRTGTM